MRRSRCEHTVYPLVVDDGLNDLRRDEVSLAAKGEVLQVQLAFELAADDVKRSAAIVGLAGAEAQVILVE